MDGVAPARQVLKLSGPPDVAAAVPFVVGFQPVESLVVIALKGPRQEILHTLRVDLRDIEEVRRRELLEQPCHPHTMAATLKRNGAEAALVVVLTDSPAGDGADLPGRALALDLRDELGSLDIPVRDAMLVQDGRWFSYLCDNPDCCPPEGTVIDGPARDRILAEMAYAGEAALTGREEVAGLVAPEDGIRARAVEAAVDALLAGGRSEDEEDPFTALRRAFQAVRAGEQPEPQTVALCLLSLPDFAIRDACLQPYEGDDGEVALELWCTLTRLAPEYLVAPPACLAAFVALCYGRGALANSAIDRALKDCPAYSFAHLLAHMAGHGAPPKLMRQIASGTLTELGYSVLGGQAEEPAEESAAG
jgi:hypothetical protein